ncbi:PEP-CTERM sorting domain-containing protein [Planctomycetota bacterium]
MFARFAIGSLLCLVGAWHAQAATIDVVPDDLSNGDQYRLVFVTSVRYESGSNDSARENARVTADADAVAVLADLGATWTAIVSTTSADARTNTDTDPTPAGSTGVPIYMIDGSRVANDYDDLWDGTLIHPINVTPTGQSSHADWSKRVWTSTKTDGTARNLYPNTVTIGYATASNGQWMGGTNSGSIKSGSDAKRLYAISSILTASESIPEPTTLGLLLVATVLGLGSFFFRRSRG